MRMRTKSYTFVIDICILWIQFNCVVSDHIPIPGAFYKRENHFANKLPAQVHREIVQSLPLCSSLCQAKACVGFFYSDTTKICALINNHVSTYQMENLPGVFYYERQDSNTSTKSQPSDLNYQTTHTPFPFKRDMNHDGLLANDVNPSGPSGNSLSDCATSCTDAECVGFFYDMKNGLCFPNKKYFLTSFSHVNNMTYYRRQVNTNSKLVTIDFNICPRYQTGEVVINMFNGENYKIFVDTDQVNQTMAVERCNKRQQQLLRMKDKIHHDYIKNLLSCNEFAGREFWVGAERTGNDWKFSDQSVLDQSYFCSYAPNEPTKQFCVGFLKGCLDDQTCADRTSFICD